MLHPKAKELLERLDAQGIGAFEKLRIEQRRAVVANIARLAGVAEPVAAVNDISIPGRDCSIPARVYRPAVEAPLPILAYFHGGGWTTGNLDIGDTTCRALANGVEAIVVNVDYRLAPEARFPAAADDAYDATRWLSENAPQFQGDGERVALCGESAGGNLAAVTAMRFRDEGRALRFQLLFYPALDSTMTTTSYSALGMGYFLTRDVMAAAWDEYAYGRLDEPYVSPLAEHDLSAMAPTLVISAEFDPLRDEGRLYAERLRSCGVSANDTCYASMIHGFVGMSSLFNEANDAIAEAVEALRGALWRMP